MADNRPIGVFDSGVGGLTVVRQISRCLPGRSIVYLADQYHVPYGARPLDEINTFAHEISRWLVSQGCGAVVMACNISSAVARDDVARELAPVPVFGMIGPIARHLKQIGEQGPIGILATEGTVRSEAYPAQIHAELPNAIVVQQACPAFVPLVESGNVDGDEALSAATAYLAPLIAEGCRSVILGCTHYPLLLSSLNHATAKLSPNPIRFFDPAEAVARELVGTLGEAPGTGTYKLFTTGDVSRFAEQAQALLGSVGRVEEVHWSDDLVLKVQGVTQ